MKNLIKILPFVMIVSACSGGGEAGAGSEIEQGGSATGSASLTIGDNSSKLTVDLCQQPKTIASEGEERTQYIVLATSSNIELSISGLKSSRGDLKNEEASFTIDVDGGVIDGGITYNEPIPYTAFDGQKLYFKGVIQARMPDGKSGEELPVEFTIDCG